MSIRFGEPGDTSADHIAQCARTDHVEFALGVYDRFGQRVNAYRSVTCGGGSAPNPDAWAAEQAPLWPGCSVAVWVDPSIEPPKKLAYGPAPDASAG